MVNSYFNILVSYVDEYEILDFRDLISVKAEAETDIRIDLRNPGTMSLRRLKRFSKLRKQKFFVRKSSGASETESIRVSGRCLV